MTYGWFRMTGLFTLPAEEQVGDVGTISDVFIRGFFLKVVRNDDAQVWAFIAFLFPFVVTVCVGESNDLATFQNIDFVAELGFAADCYPKTFGDKD